VKNILILGSDSDLAKNLFNNIDKSKNKIYRINKKKINFLNNDSKKKLFFFLKKNKPDIIINCIGFFDNNNGDFDKIFKINIYSVWLLVKYFFLKNNSKVKIMIIGSSSFNKPRKNYILYTAAKTAVNNIYLSAKELFKDTNIKFYIINPISMKTKMRKRVIKLLNLNDSLHSAIDVEVISKQIIKIMKI
jgi:short-subunit dehydrogenase